MWFNKIFYLPASFKAVYQELSLEKSSPNLDVLAQCRNELIQAIWDILLLDPKFKKVYAEGILLQCSDEIIKEGFPRILTDSSDYPERLKLHYYIYYNINHE